MPAVDGSNLTSVFKKDLTYLEKKGPRYCALTWLFFMENHDFY